MAKYFSKFPKILYNKFVVTDLLTRINIRETWLNNPSLYYDYLYKDLDRPEHIAQKYYGDEDLHWIIMITNKAFDKNFDFPMSYGVFSKYIEDKYKALGELENKSGIEYAQSTVDPMFGYQKKVTIYNANYTEQINYYVIDEESFNNFSDISSVVTSPSGEILTYEEVKRFPQVTIYDVEFEINESKRPVKILKKDYIPQAKEELSKLLA